MSLDISQYERVYARKKGVAITISKTLIEDITETVALPTYSGDSCIVIQKKNLNVPKEHMLSILVIVDAIMYSSGYYCSSSIKTQKNGMLSIDHKICVMSADDRVNLLSPLPSDTETESDPEPVFTEEELSRK